ncbi:hypothetical protein AMTRI_Chr03g45890 [Amborella trichopoda]
MILSHPWQTKRACCDFSGTDGELRTLENPRASMFCSPETPRAPSFPFSESPRASNFCLSENSRASSFCVVEESRVLRSGVMEQVIESLLGFSDSEALDVALEQMMDRKESESSKDEFVEDTLQLSSLLRESAERLARKRASFHNSVVWPLGSDLTIQVFSKLDTRSLSQAGATCSLFNKCSVDPSCYADLELTSRSPKISNATVNTMIQRAGGNLQSLRLGIISEPSETERSYGSAVDFTQRSMDSLDSWHSRRSMQGRETSVLTRTCLSSLSMDNGAIGALLKRLHLYNIERMDNASFCAALSVCPSLIDLEVLGLHIELRQALKTLSSSCRGLERLVIESAKSGRDESLKSATCAELVNGCPLISSLAIRAFKLSDQKVRILCKGFRNLRFLDLSSAYSICGLFLRSLTETESLLETLILRDCMHLKEVEVNRFLSAIHTGDLQFLRFFDISNKDGLASDDDWYNRCYTPSQEHISRVQSERPEIRIVADFPLDRSFTELEHMIDSDINSDDSAALHMSDRASSYSIPFPSSSDSSYSNDPGSGNEDSQNAHNDLYDEFSDGNDSPYRY